MKKPFVIIILGPPGSGKGTQAELLEEKLNLYHLNTSGIIVANLLNAKKSDFVKVGGKKYFLLEEKKLRESGKLMSPPLIAFWIKNKIRELAKGGKGIVASSSPRTLYEGEEIIPLFKKLYGSSSIKIILIELSEKESIRRNWYRRTCKLMRHPILYTKETAKLTKCPLDGSKLVIRKDDTPKTIKVRLMEYKKRTFPLVSYFKKQGLKVKKVDGKQSVEKVFKDILKAIKI
ncbi:nucleoside monophosphate kinase [Patescibacteria group bacterium]|nr:nucleoside monophosphate kinase [Patescibacteria group bacterium]